MAAEHFVDVTYRGIELGKTLRLTEVGPTTAFVEHPTPMPVGAPVELKTDAEVAINAVVLRVTEQVAGAETPAGMRVRVDDLTGEVEAWWASKVTIDDPVIPTPPASAQPEPEPGPAAAPEPEPEPEPQAEAVPEQYLDGATDPVPAPEPEAEPEAEPTADADVEAVTAAASRRGGGRSTMMMSTDEIRAAIEAGGQELGDQNGEADNGEADNGEADNGEADNGEDGFGEVDAAIEDKAKGKKKKRRRKKRKTKG